MADKIDKTDVKVSKKTYAERRADLDMYNGTLRVVTEDDVLSDPRVVAAGAVVGQLYDFSNLPFVKDNALEDYVVGENEKKDKIAEAAEAEVVAPRYSTEFEREALGVENPEDKPDTDITK